MSWLREFETPIAVGGRTLITLQDTDEYIAALPAQGFGEGSLVTPACPAPSAIRRAMKPAAIAERFCARQGSDLTQSAMTCLRRIA